MNLDQMAEQANQRISYFVNRSAGQHIRAMRAQWSASKQPMWIGVDMAKEPEQTAVFFVRGPKFEIEFFGDEPDEPSAPRDKSARLVLILMMLTAAYAAGDFFFRIFFK